MTKAWDAAIDAALPIGFDDAQRRELPRYLPVVQRAGERALRAFG
ncbi:hypothetical protein [Nonomuraea gerenzanensis]|uniref:Uncharacterized protein n=1 Tax=Nonomuraea gerenzanensis TaxID=93944 RepID=A0A1M4DVN8_9ACTN|nr:hypothetical protein [Nonomuraea gerenzanensis]SBO90626.1 hypothetical protein BN4615_P140 [Nonomuraea gerenzanensis]